MVTMLQQSSTLQSDNSSIRQTTANTCRTFEQVAAAAAVYATAPWVLRVQLDRKPNCIARTTIIKAAYACASNGRQSAFTRNQSFAAKIRQRCRASLHRQRTSYRWCKYNDYMKQRRQRATYSQFISVIITNFHRSQRRPSETENSTNSRPPPDHPP